MILILGLLEMALLNTIPQPQDQGFLATGNKPTFSPNKKIYLKVIMLC